jgi:hypothetical protein
LVALDLESGTLAEPDAADAGKRTARALIYHRFYPARFLDMVGVTGSIPVAPTIEKLNKSSGSRFVWRGEHCLAVSEQTWNFAQEPRQFGQGVGKVSAQRSPPWIERAMRSNSDEIGRDR